MEKLRLDIIGMSYSQSQSGAYALILGERDGKRRLPIIIGGFEAQAIAIELEKIKTPRPLTHDLFKSFADQFGIDIVEVIINEFTEGVFHSQLICTNGTDTQIVDSRTSDAIALALRFNCPVFTFETIMAAAGILMEDEKEIVVPESPEKKSKTPGDHSLDAYSLEELNELLQTAIEAEDYEKASHIRDEINRRRK
jgi:bifunctional DNase/RNase